MKLFKKLPLTLLVLAGATPFVSAQSTLAGQAAQTLTMQRNDSIIIADMINPRVKDAGENGQDPDWEGLRASVTLKYDASYADRTVTKARIYYYYGKDWSLFSTAIVHYTVAYEDKEDLRLMNKNARFILKYSQNPAEWKTALDWVKHAVEKEPANAAYKETYDGLEAKIKG